MYIYIYTCAGSHPPRPSVAAQLAAAGVVQTAQCVAVATGVLFPAGAAEAAGVLGTAAPHIGARAAALCGGGVR